MAVNDYIAQGGSGFSVLKRNTTKFNTGISLRDGLVDYIRSLPVRCDPAQYTNVVGTTCKDAQGETFDCSTTCCCHSTDPNADQVACSTRAASVQPVHCRRRLVSTTWARRYACTKQCCVYDKSSGIAASSANSAEFQAWPRERKMFPSAQFLSPIDGRIETQGGGDSGGMSCEQLVSALAAIRAPRPLTGVRRSIRSMGAGRWGRRIASVQPAGYGVA